MQMIRFSFLALLTFLAATSAKASTLSQAPNAGQWTCFADGYIAGPYGTSGQSETAIGDPQSSQSQARASAMDNCLAMGLMSCEVTSCLQSAH